MDAWAQTVRKHKQASKMNGKEQKPLGCMCKIQMKQKACQIVSEPVHPLLKEFIKLPSGLTL